MEKEDPKKIKKELEKLMEKLWQSKDRGEFDEGKTIEKAPSPLWEPPKKEGETSP